MIFPDCGFWVASVCPSSAVDSLWVVSRVSTRESSLCQVREGYYVHLADAMVRDKVPNPGLPFAGRQPPNSDHLHMLLLCPGFTNVLKILTKESSREELLSFIQHYGSHYIAEALYGSELTCIIHFPSKKVQQQLWLQYQKGKPGGLAGGGGQLRHGGQAAGEITELPGSQILALPRRNWAAVNKSLRLSGLHVHQGWNEGPCDDSSGFFQFRRFLRPQGGLQNSGLLLRVPCFPLCPLKTTAKVRRLGKL